MASSFPHSQYFVSVVASRFVQSGLSVKMYQKNLKTYFNQNYGPGKRSLNGHQSTAAVRQNKKMLEEDSGAEDDFAPYKAREKEGFLNEKNVGSVMFLVTISVLLAKLYEMFSKD